MDNFMANQVMMAFATQGVTEEESAARATEEDEEDPTVEKPNKGNTLPFWGNSQTMNLNPLIWTNVTGSPYFKVNLFGLKTYHEVIDEIYYKVNHCEPWERGSRKTSGQTGMCGGVRGVGAGGIVSSAYCLLYKLFTLKLTRKQVNGMLNHCDSPYIRALGFMYIRYTQPPGDLWSWFEGYLEDEEEIDTKAGGGKLQTIGEMCRQMITKLEWFDTRFPRIPVSTQKSIDSHLEAHFSTGKCHEEINPPPMHNSKVVDSGSKKEKSSKDRRERKEESRSSRKSSRDHRRSRSKERKRSPRSKSHSSSHKRHKRSRSRSRDRNRSNKHKRDSKRSHTPDYQEELRSYSEHRKKSKSHRRSRSRDRR